MIQRRDRHLCLSAFAAAILTLLLVLSPLAAISMEQTGKCHCFQHREFEPVNRFLADEYLLATVSNSLIASHFDISKRQIVMKKMQGDTGNEDLLIGLYLSSLTGIDLQDLLTEKKSASWQEIAATKPRIQKSEDLPSRLLKEGKSDKEVSSAITALMLQKRFGENEATSSLLDTANLSDQEKIVVMTLSDHTRIPPQPIIDQYLSEKRSWSEIAYNFGLQPAYVGKLLLQEEEKK